MSKMSDYVEAQKYGRLPGFIADIVLKSHVNPARKLAGLVKLLKAGHRVRPARFSMDILVIDDRCYEWSVLETPELVEHGVAACPSMASALVSVLTE